MPDRLDRLTDRDDEFVVTHGDPATHVTSLQVSVRTPCRRGGGIDGCRQPGKDGDTLPAAQLSGGCTVPARARDAQSAQGGRCPGCCLGEEGLHDTRALVECAVEPMCRLLGDLAVQGCPAGVEKQGAAGLDSQPPIGVVDGLGEDRERP